MIRLCFLTAILLFFTCHYSLAQTTLSSDSKEIDVLPEYPGGYKSFFKYISKEFKFPKSALKSQYLGKVLITMIVEADGKVTVDSLDFSKMNYYGKKADDTLKAEAREDVESEIRKMFGNMPSWKPGSINGRPIRVKYNLPYNLGLE